jgi:hypothetical protein
MGLLLFDIGFLMTWHNLDVLQSYSLLYNDFNEKACIMHEDLRDLEDCGVFTCQKFQSIYINGKTLQLIMFFGVNMMFFINNVGIIPTNAS